MKEDEESSNSNSNKRFDIWRPALSSESSMAFAIARRAFLSLHHPSWVSKSARNLNSKSTRNLSSARPDPDFGIMFDIDGVIVRGKKVLPFAADAFKKLVNNQVSLLIIIIISQNDEWYFVKNSKESLSDKFVKKVS